MVKADQEEKDRKDLMAALDGWAQAFVLENPETILACYAPDALLWGTLSPRLRETPAEIRSYFERVFAFGRRSVCFHDANIRFYGPVGLATGAYTFSWDIEGQRQRVPARYSIAWVRGDGRWLIVDHHSSVMPAASG